MYDHTHLHHIRESEHLAHYHLAQGVHALFVRFPEDEALMALDKAIRKKSPANTHLAKHAVICKAALFAHQKHLNHVDYANIYHLIEDAIQRTQE